MSTYFFDFIIVAFLIYSIYWMYIIIHSFLKHKKISLLQIIIFAIALLVFISLIYGSFIEPRLITLKNIDLTIGSTPEKESIKIVFITDTHAGKYKKGNYFKKIAKLTLQQNPDLILFGGDYIFQKAEYAKYLKPFELLDHKFPMYAVTGNHEYNKASYFDNRELIDKSQPTRELFQKIGIEFLDNKNQIISLQNQEIAIIGVEDMYAKKDDLDKALENIPANILKILISHNPDIILQDKAQMINLVLSGHTHAGQIRLPWFGAIPGLGTKLGKKYDQGLFKTQNGYLYISAGLGESGTRARFFNRPELTIINLDL